MKTWETVDRRIILDLGKFLVVENHGVRLPDGRMIKDWPWVITPDYVNVVAVTEEGKFLFFRQTKYAVEGVVMAPVGGYIEKGEEPLPAAKRELLEETGHEAAAWVDLGRYAVDGNRGAGTAHLFLALGTKKVRERQTDDLEHQELVMLTRSEVEAALSSGEFRVLAWGAIVALALHCLR